MIAKKYILQHQIGKGKFGSVYKGIHLNGSPVAIKQDTSPLLKHETTILYYLFRNGVRKHIPIVHWFGIYQKCPTLIMTFLDRHPTPTEIRANASTIINIICTIHNLGILHRDIKPTNFMMHSSNIIYLIDFGFATPFVIDNIHKPNVLSSFIVGTPHYISYFVQCGNEPSRRDDLLSLGYILLEDRLERIEFHSSSELPCYHIDHPLNKAYLIKKHLECILPACPLFLKDFFRILYDIPYDAKPDYDSLANGLDGRGDGADGQLPK
jgi:serine/threonine protein kinase